MPRAFIIRPFRAKPVIGGGEIDFDQISEKLIDPALKKAGFEGGTTEKIVTSGNIREDMYWLIPTADLVLCDITIPNANVFYELGVRHALRKKCSVLIRGTPSDEEVPFDILTDRYLEYELNNPGAAVDRLARTLIATLASGNTDSPIFKMLPGLPEVDPDLIRVLPRGLAEEVERARAGNAAGWLRLLSQEVENRDFGGPALRIIGRAQWDIEDDDGARKTYQLLMGNDAEDLEANIALANLYERQYRKEKQLALLTTSDQAIKRVLNNNRATQEQRTEALSLMGRNAKTQWQQEFEHLGDVLERRKAAINRKLFDACDAYLNAYSVNLNHYGSGIAALRMCAIAKSLADDNMWEDAFDDEKAAKNRRDELLKAFDQLQDPLEIAVKTAQKRPLGDSNYRILSDVANADRLFLTNAKDLRVLRAYKDAIRPTEMRLGSAVKAELELLGKLGIRAPLVEMILKDCGLLELGTQENLKPTFVILVGHRVDEPGRPQIRFPTQAVGAVTSKLREKLSELKTCAGGIRVLSSAAPGTDIICHELCAELEIRSTVCLPTTMEIYSQNAFKGELDIWRKRFFKLMGTAGVNCLQLSESPGLPKWLEGTATSEWERGNNWVLQLALSAGAPSVSLIAVWDGKDIGDGRGGTAHMVQIARAAGNVDVDVIRLKDGVVVAETG